MLIEIFLSPHIKLQKFCSQKLFCKNHPKTLRKFYSHNRFFCRIQYFRVFCVVLAQNLSIMKKILFSLILFFIGGFLFAQSGADAIQGYYYLEDPFSGAISQVKIYKTSSGKYEGVVEWAKDPERKKFEGMVFLKDLTYNSAEKEWQNGKIQYPGKKGVFDTFMRFTDDGKLRVRGYWKAAVLGKTVYWTKESKSRKTK